MYSGRITRRAALAGVPALGYGVVARARTAWPTRTVELILPVPPGGSLGLAGTLLAEALSRRWQQRVATVNIVGHSNIDGTAAIARARPDGYRLGLVGTALGIDQALRDHLPYNALTDLVPVCRVAATQFCLLAQPALPVRTVAELIAYARRAPAPLTYASAGVGTGSHLAAESFAFEAGIKLVHRPYDGTVKAQAAVERGEVSLLSQSLSTPLEAARKGPLRMVAAMGTPATPDLSDTPWVSTALPGFQLSGTVGVVAPKGLDRDLQEHIAREISAEVNTPALRTALAAAGLEAVASSPAEYDVRLRGDIARWRLVGRIAGIHLS